MSNTGRLLWKIETFVRLLFICETHGMASNLLYPEDDFELLIFLSPLPECWNYVVYVVKSRTSSMKKNLPTELHTQSKTFIKPTSVLKNKAKTFHV